MKEDTIYKGLTILFALIILCQVAYIVDTRNNYTMDGIKLDGETMNNIKIPKKLVKELGSQMDEFAICTENQDQCFQFLKTSSINKNG